MLPSDFSSKIMSVSGKNLTRFCIKNNEKLFDLKKCFLCSAYLLKEKYEMPDIDLPDNSALRGHLKFNSCEFAHNLNFEELSKRDSNPAGVKTMHGLTKKFFSKLKLTPESIVSIITANWDKIVGDTFKEKLVPVKFSRGSLIIKSSSPSLTQDFLFVKTDVMKNINVLLKSEKIFKIKIQQ